MEDMFWILPQLGWKNCISADMMKTSYLLGLLHIHRRQMPTSEPSMYSSSLRSGPLHITKLCVLFTQCCICVCVCVCVYVFVVLTTDSMKWLVFVMAKRVVLCEVKNLNLNSLRLTWGVGGLIYGCSVWLCSKWQMKRRSTKAKMDGTSEK